MVLHKANWKDKGGFEGLMANPMFTLGLGLMKSSASGQPISQSLLDNAVKAGAYHLLMRIELDLENKLLLKQQLKI